MNQNQEIQHPICPYCILGVRAGVSHPEVEEAYQRLINAFAEENFMETPQDWVQAQQAYVAIDSAYRQIVEGERNQTIEACREPEVLGDCISPKLGQMLVASGIITLEQLEEAIDKQVTCDLPLGEVLKTSSLITQMELDAFLLNQKQIMLPPDSPYLIGQRLIGLGLVSEDMVRIALIEQRTSNKPLGQTLVEHGWLSDNILNVLINEKGVKAQDDQSRLSV